MDLALPITSLLGFSLALVRTTAWIVICPPFNSPAVPRRVRVGLATAIALLLSARISPVIDPAMTTGELIVLAVAQIGAGLALGFLVYIMFMAVQAAGDLIDLQIGFALGAVLDPLSGTSASPIGRFHQLLAISIMFAIDGHTLVVRGFLRSVEAVPLGGLDLGHLADQLVTLLGAFFVAAVEIGLPVLAALFLAEIALGLLGKAAPQMNILMIGFAAKGFMAIVLLSLTILATPDSVESLIVTALRAGGRVIGG